MALNFLKIKFTVVYFILLIDLIYSTIFKHKIDFFNIFYIF
jgi:hypothetical protein